jgi:signal peptidase I
MLPGNSPDFIKRCTGLPGDTIRITPPLLYVNDQLDSGSPVFDKQFRIEAPYKGYKTIGGAPTLTFVVPPHHYWAMGDNSGDSLDSRYWGGVPEQNIAGKGLFVLWPFTSRWGFIQ